MGISASSLHAVHIHLIDASLFYFVVLSVREVNVNQERSDCGAVVFVTPKVFKPHSLEEDRHKLPKGLELT